MRIAYTVWTWMKDEFGRNWIPTENAATNFAAAAEEIASLGYDAIENFNFIVPAYENNPEELDALMKKTGLKFVNIYHSLNDGYDIDMEGAERCCKFMQKHDIPWLNVQAARVPNDKPVTHELLDELCRELNDMGKLCKKYGVTLCLHPHARSWVETEWQTDYVAAHTDPGDVKFCLDTCHLVLGGLDPVAAFEKYMDRIAYVHFKDVIGDYKKPYPESPTENARPLGQGIVDYPGVMKVLKAHNYDGVICVEVDYPHPDSYTAAKISREYIRDVLGL